MTPKITLTTEECCELFRNNGISIGLETLRDGIKAGKFPFGIAIEGSGRWVFIVYRKQVIDYLRSVGANINDQTTA